MDVGADRSFGIVRRGGDGLQRRIRTTGHVPTPDAADLYRRNCSKKRQIRSVALIWNVVKPVRELIDLLNELPGHA